MCSEFTKTLYSDTVAQMKTLLAVSLTAFAALLSSGAQAASQQDMDDMRRAFEASQKAEGTEFGDYTLTNQDGARFSLREYFSAGKPTVLSFIYTSCPEVCPTITADIKRVGGRVYEKYGDRFHVLTIGFDPENDTPEKLKEYGGKFVKDFKLFRFAAAEEKTIKALTTEAGFYFKKNADGSFDHIDMVTIVKPDGTIYKQVYGVRGNPEAVAERLTELLDGRPYSSGPPSVIERLKYFCFKYDPVTGRYVLDYQVLGGVALQALVIGAVIYFVWGRRRKAGE